MTREFFNQHFAVLVNVFIAAQLTAEAQDIYWEMLKDIPQEKFGEGVKHCIATCKFFPTIAELGEASLPTLTKIISRCPPYNPHGRHGDYLATPLEIKIDWRGQLEQQDRGRLKIVDTRRQAKR